MKKILYFALLAAELFVGSVLMISLWESSVYLSVAVAVAAVLSLLVWQLVRYVKATDPEAKKKIRLYIALLGLIPIAVFFATYVVVAIAFVIASF